jgi:hypothetical protein
MENKLPHVSNDGRHPQHAPVLTVWRMTLGTDKVSTILPTIIDGFMEQSVGGNADPMWMRQLPLAVSNIWMSILPVGWIGEWHESPAPQWVVPLSGRWFVETQDGKRVEMGPGDIHWGEDINTSGPQERRGHRSGQIGDVPCVQLMIQFHANATFPSASS